MKDVENGNIRLKERAKDQLFEMKSLQDVHPDRAFLVFKYNWLKDPSI